MRGSDADALLERLAPDGEEKQVLAAVVEILFVADAQLFAKLPRGESGGFRHAYALADGLALGLCGVEKTHVVAGVFICRLGVGSLENVFL